MKKYWFLGAMALMLTITSCKKKAKNNDKNNTPAFEVYKDGTKVNNNETFVFDTTGTAATLNLVIKNTSSETIHLKTHLVNDSSGNNGNFMEFCFGNCYLNMQPNVSYPVGSTLDVTAGSKTAGDAVHFINHYGSEVSYSIEIYTVDEAGNKIGDPFTFIYKYQP